MMLKLTDEGRAFLKHPLGTLFRDIDSAAQALSKIRPIKLISVGDAVTAGLISAGIKPNTIVVDFNVMRSPANEEIRKKIENFNAKIVKVKNPAGTITQELCRALEINPPVKIIVDGEEDLAALQAVISAPVGSVVAYGQPKEGVVLVEVTEEKKKEFKGLLKRFFIVGDNLNKVP